MSEPNDKGNNQNAENAENPRPAPKSGSMIKYIIIAFVLMVIVIGATTGVMMIMGQQTANVPETIASGPEGEQSPMNEPSDKEILDSLPDGETDQSVLDMINANLNALDWEPDMSELTGAEFGMSVEDSIESANWLKKETEQLRKQRDVLEKREKELAKREKEVATKMLKIEQAESARINNLAKLYDGMDPRSVAQLMANLDDETIVAIIPRMKTKKASEVLQLLPPKRAASLSKQMITIAEK